MDFGFEINIVLYQKRSDSSVAQCFVCEAKLNGWLFTVCLLPYKLTYEQIHHIHSWHYERRSCDCRNTSSHLSYSLSSKRRIYPWSYPWGISSYFHWDYCRSHWQDDHCAQIYTECQKGFTNLNCYSMKTYPHGRNFRASIIGMTSNISEMISGSQGCLTHRYMCLPKGNADLFWPLTEMISKTLRERAEQRVSCSSQITWPMNALIPNSPLFSQKILPTRSTANSLQLPVKPHLPMPPEL